MAKTEISLQDLLEAGAHFGHQPRRWNPRMKAYLYGARKGVHIFDLVQTKKMLEGACDFVKQLVSEGKIIVFVGTKRQAADVIREEAKRAEVPYVAQRWLGGTITNWEQIRKSIKKLKEMKEKREAGEYDKYTKKENLLISREITRLEKFFGGLSALEGIPEAIFVVDVKREEAAIKEAQKKGVTIVAMVDSNSDPTPVDYAIPINDDAVRSIKLVVSCLADSVIEGRQLGEKKKPPKGRSRPKDDGRKKTTKKKSQRTTIDKTKKTKKTKKKAKEKSKKGD